MFRLHRGSRLSPGLVTLFVAGASLLAAAPASAVTAPVVDITQVTDGQVISYDRPLVGYNVQGAVPVGTVVRLTLGPIQTDAPLTTYSSGGYGSTYLTLAPNSPDPSAYLADGP